MGWSGKLLSLLPAADLIFGGISDTIIREGEVAATGYRMKYFDKAMKDQKISERSVLRLAYIEKHGARGRFEIRTDTGELWDNHEVRTLQERGLWDVEWLEPGDEKYEGGWRILGLLDVGRNVLRKWQERDASQK